MATPSTSLEAPAQESPSASASHSLQHQLSASSDPDRVRRRLEAILAEMRGEQKMTWDVAIQALYQELFPDMTYCLPADEGARYRADFGKEWSRLEAP